MSILDNYTPLKELGNGSTTEFSDSWQILSEDYIRVYLEDVTTGVQTLQAQGSDYTLVFSEDGFVVTFLTAPTSANYVVIARKVDVTQIVPYKTSKGFQGIIQEGSFDKLTAIVQDQQDDIDRSPKTQVGSDPLVFPGWVAGLNIGWSDTENSEIVNGTKTTAEIDAAVDAVAGLSSGSGVLTSSADQAVGFLNTKLIEGNALSFTINNPGEVETLTIDVSSATEEAAGVVEAANTAEMTAGTADKFPDAEKVKGYVDGLTIFTKPFKSAEIAITNGGTADIAHGLGATPLLVTAYLVCKTAEFGYAVGEEYSPAYFSAPSLVQTNLGVSIWWGGTNVSYCFAGEVNPFQILDTTTKTRTALTNANWKLVIRAWA